MCALRIWLRIHAVSSVFSLFAWKNLCNLGYPKCAQWRFWSDCANAQADLNLHRAHMAVGTFTGVIVHIVDDVRTSYRCARFTDLSLIYLDNLCFWTVSRWFTCRSVFYWNELQIYLFIYLFIYFIYLFIYLRKGANISSAELFPLEVYPFL